MRPYNDIHRTACTCSYCRGDGKLHYGLNIPADWSAWNAWWVIKYWPQRYLRWTNDWLRRRPTVHELEAILSAPNTGRVVINQDGSLRVTDDPEERSGKPILVPLHEALKGTY